jgi:uncharacterized protein (DUF885 family)
MRFITLFAVVLTMVSLVSCGGPSSQDADFERVANSYIDTYLQMNPELATSLGEHRYDGRLNDYSKAGVEKAIAFDQKLLEQLSTMDPSHLNRDNKVDYMILRNQAEGEIFQLQELREYEWNPLVYNLGGAIYYLVARDFAPFEDRMRNVGERLEQIPAVLDLAKANLKNPPKVHTETAIQQNQGTISLVRDELDTLMKDMPGLKAELAPAQEKAVEALQAYGEWLQNDLLPVSNGDFRLGSERYRKKLAYVLDSEFTPEEILRRAQKDLADTQDKMLQVAATLYAQYFPSETAKGKPLDKKHVIKAVLDKLAESHPTNATIVDKAHACLEECEDFTRMNELVTMPDEPVELIVMPEFQRGVAVAYCDAPGPLEPEGKTFFAISPTPASWSPERVESFFREYNDYMLQDLTIHEAVPGHYLQLAHANRFKAPTMVRAIFSSGPFVEGWATYAEQVMAEKGYGGPEVVMQQLKMRLRLIINAIIDQKIHAEGMTEDEAMDMMINDGFQEEGEAAGKWRRACLTSTQLSTYYVGNMEINDIRDAYEAEHGKHATMRAMHDEMLSFGSPPPKYVKSLMGL